MIKLEDLNVISKLTKICEKYKEEMYVDVLNGRYVVDGASILGVTSLLGNIVTIDPNTNDAELIGSFYKDIKEIGAWEVKN